MKDDRICCNDCRDLSPTGRCRVAMRGERKDVSSHYGPDDPARPQRCIWFGPKPGATDQRIGIELFPVLWREYKVRYPEPAMPGAPR